MVERVNGAMNVSQAASVEKAAPKAEAKTNVKMVDKEKAAQRQAAQSLRQLAASGTAEYVDTNIFEDILNYVIDHKAGDYIRVNLGTNGGQKMTLGEAKQRLKLNLPAGSLRNNDVDGGGGDFDKHSVPKDKNGNYYVDIFVSDLTKGTGLSKDEIKQIVPAEK